MAEDGSRLLYLARHAEPTADGSELTARGVEQAEHLGQRLAALPLTRVLHGPLPRARETARVVARQLESEPRMSCVDEAGDFVPRVPDHDEVSPAWADAVFGFLAGTTAQEQSDGAALAVRATDVLAGARSPDREPVDVVITHAFTIGWLVRQALDAPEWRWWGLNHCHAGLTVIRYSSTRPPSILVFNDLTHLPAELRWTGFPDHYRA